MGALFVWAGNESGLIGKACLKTPTMFGHIVGQLKRGLHVQRTPMWVLQFDFTEVLGVLHKLVKQGLIFGSCVLMKAKINISLICMESVTKVLKCPALFHGIQNSFLLYILDF